MNVLDDDARLAKLLTLRARVDAEIREITAKPKRHRCKGIPACGTESAYSRHLRQGETPCEDCKAAHAARERIRKRERKAS